jgi:hypothetical protein
MSIRIKHLCAGILLLAGCGPAHSVTEEEYLRNLSIQTSVNQADAAEFTVSVDTGVQDPELWERIRVSLITSEGEHSLVEATSILGAGGTAIRVPVDSVPGVDLSRLNVQVEYAVYRGEPTDGEMLFSGTVGIEAEHSLDGPQSDEPENSGESQASSGE